jgi:uncharacterized heparinase superfamily protein
MTLRGRAYLRLSRLVAARGMARFSPGRLLRHAPQMSPSAEVLAAPRLVVEGDPRRGAEFYAGVFLFAGHRVEAAGRSIFAMPPPSAEWARELHGFSWLDDLAAADTQLSRAYARTLVEEWSASCRMNRTARQPDVLARRLIHFLAHATFLTGDADADFRRQFLRMLGRHVRDLRYDLRRLPAGLPRLMPAIALAHAGLSLPDGTRMLRTAGGHLNAELRRLVLTDGGPATRNPNDLLKWAADLLPLRLGFAQRAIEPPRELLPTLDRIMPMLRFFRHGDGNLALFNGMGPTRQDCLDAVLAHDDTGGSPVRDASYAGYQRLEASGTIVLADTGTQPPLEVSAGAHAGTLSFELSSSAERLVVNCGAPEGGSAALRHAARRTAAHSTMSLADSSSSRFLRGIAARLAGPLLREGPRVVDVARDDRRDAQMLRASHDGYAARLGFVHERTLRLHSTGRQLDGMDVLKPVRQGSTTAVLRFHLHPSVRATRLNDGRAVLLVPPSGDVWLFSCDDYPAEIEESVFFALPGAPARAEQIVVNLGRKAGARVSWSFTRTGSEIAPAALGLN